MTLCDGCKLEKWCTEEYLCNAYFRLQELKESRVWSIAEKLGAVFDDVEDIVDEAGKLLEDVEL